MEGEGDLEVVLICTNVNGFTPHRCTHKSTGKYAQMYTQIPQSAGVDPLIEANWATTQGGGS